MKETIVWRFQYESADELNEHMQAFLLAYNHTKRLNAHGLTPHELICAQWQKNSAILARARPTLRWNCTVGHIYLAHRK